MPSEPNRATEYRYDSAGRVVQVITHTSSAAEGSSGGERTEHHCAERVELTRMTDAHGTVHEYAYDALGRVVCDRMTLPAGGESNPAATE